MLYTKEAQTADQYIEKFARDHQKKYDITVATSDGLQQIIIRGSGAKLLSATDLKVEIEGANERIKQQYQESQRENRHYLIDTLSEDEKQKMEEFIRTKQ
jgi:predicted RNA-binding protein with PIN domain